MRAATCSGASRSCQWGVPGDGLASRGGEFFFIESHEPEKKGAFEAPFVLCPAGPCAPAARSASSVSAGCSIPRRLARAGAHTGAPKRPLGTPGTAPFSTPRPAPPCTAAATPRACPRARRRRGGCCGGTPSRSKWTIPQVRHSLSACSTPRRAPQQGGSNLTKPGRRAHRTGCRAAEALLAHDAMRTRRADHDGAAGRDEARREPAGAARVGPCVPGPETRRGTWARGPVTCCARRGAGMRMRAGAQGVRALL